MCDGVERFKNYIISNCVVNIKTKCWIWTKCKHNLGYGHGYDGKKVEKAHRISYKAFKGEIPNGICVCHSCDEPSCVNPDHLFLGTIGDNMRDKKLKGRARGCPGKSHPNSKLTVCQVKKIRNLYESKELDQPSLAKKYNVSQVSISNILNRKTWGL